MNLLEGTLSPNADEVALGSQRITLSSDVVNEHPGLKKYAGRSLVVGIRPEDLPAAEGDRGGQILTGDVHLVEALGAEKLVHFRFDAPIVQLEDTSITDQGDEILVSNQSAISECVARVEPRFQVTAGERFSFRVSPERLEFFDVETGIAIWD
jgi:multiple sugar transport system ATP-binding protein